ncbi:MAG: hypothetical protein IJR57_06930 [Ruminococcus sp.]|nr:hypothetical protein [Ruminococcus sp.]
MGLFEPKWMSDNRAKALKAVEKITDPQKLAEVAVNAKDQVVVSKAIERIHEEAVLARIALGNSDNRAKALKAVEKITDPQKLAEVAVNAKNHDVVSKAIERIHEEAVLAGIALGNANYYSIKKALERVTHADLLMQIADEAENNWVRISALSILTKHNHNLDLMPYKDLIEVCVKAGNMEAISLCTDRVFLESVYQLKYSKWNWRIKKSFKERINQLTLDYIRDIQLPSGLKQFVARENFWFYSDDVRNAAQSKLNAMILRENASQEEVFKAVLLYPEIISEALSRLSDPELLGKLARNTLFSLETRVQIAEKAGIGNPFGRRTLVCPNCGKPAVYSEMYESIDSWQIEKEYLCSEFKQGCASSGPDNPLDAFVIGDGDINWKGELIFICPSCGKIRLSSGKDDASAFQKPCDCGCEERPIPVEYHFGAF